MAKLPRRHEQGTMCWCGNPNCPGGLDGAPAGYTATEAGERPSDMSSSRDRFVQEMLRVQMAMRDRRFSSIDPMMEFRPDRQPEVRGPSVPQAYTDAREKVKDLILDVKHETAWDDVVGNDTARAAMIEAIEEPKRHPDLYKYYGMTPPKGILLFGPPGCGKTMFAKAAAAAVGRIYGAKSEVLLVNGPAIQSPYVGVTEEKIRQIFAFAREYHKHHKHPLTVFFDEAEALFPDRTGRVRMVAPWEESQVAQFLAEMDGLDALGAFVILATNRPEAIDEALLRDGRCDRKIKVERPTKEAVEHILRKTLTGVPAKASIDDLVMAGAESFFNPHYVIHEGHLLTQRLKATGIETISDVAVNFCLEHVVSGAMVVGVGRRAKSRAFIRDRESGRQEGLVVQDVLEAVKEIFEENKGLGHGFALREFVDAVPMQQMLEPRGRMQ